MKQKLQNLIADGKTKQVLDYLRKLIPFLKKDKQEDILIQANHFSNLNKEKQNGVLSDNEAASKLTKINLALLNIISDLPKPIPIVFSNRNKFKRNTFWVSLTLVLAIFIATFYFQYTFQEASLFNENPKEEIESKLQNNSIDSLYETRKEKVVIDSPKLNNRPSPSIINNEVNLHDSAKIETIIMGNENATIINN